MDNISSNPSMPPYNNAGPNTTNQHPQLQRHGFLGHGRLSEPQDQPNTNSIANQSPNLTPASVASPIAPSSSGGGSKRSRNRPPSRATSIASNTNTNVSFQSKSMELTPAPLRKKPKMDDRQVPDSISILLPQVSLFNRLVELEGRIDAIITRKKSEIQERIKNPTRIRKTLRLYIFNTFESLEVNTDTEKGNSSPSWSLRIIGRVLEDGKDPFLLKQDVNSQPDLSSFFKKLTIYLDQSLYPTNHVILWENTKSSDLHQAFEVSRNGDKEFTARIRLEMNNVPEKFKLSSALSEIVGFETETRQRVTMAIWQYIKSKKLLILGDPSSFTCDLNLQRVFGDEKVRFSSISQRLSSHLTTLPPIHLEHRIKLSGPSPTKATCYDIAIDVPSPLQKDFTSFLDKKNETDSFDEDIIKSIKKLRELNCKRVFFEGFSESPAAFINLLIDSQGKDLKLAGGDGSKNMEDEQRSDFYNQTWVDEAVTRYIKRRSLGVDANVIT